MHWHGGLTPSKKPPGKARHMRRRKKLQPSANGENGRDEQGRFVRGNRGGPGNPMAARIFSFRQACMDAISPAELQRVLRKLLAMARRGDVSAARVLLERVLGRPALGDPQLAEDPYDPDERFL